MNKQALDQVKTFIYGMSDDGLDPKYIFKKLSKFNNKEKTTNFKDEQRVEQTLHQRRYAADK